MVTLFLLDEYSAVLKQLRIRPGEVVDVKLLEEILLAAEVVGATIHVEMDFFSGWNSFPLVAKQGGKH